MADQQPPTLKKPHFDYRYGRAEGVFYCSLITSVFSYLYSYWEGELLTLTLELSSFAFLFTALLALAAGHLHKFLPGFTEQFRGYLDGCLLACCLAFLAFELVTLSPQEEIVQGGLKLMTLSFLTLALVAFCLLLKPRWKIFSGS
jgi:hypothetical protein